MPATGSSGLFGHSDNAAGQRTGQTVSHDACFPGPPNTGSATCYTPKSVNQYNSVRSTSALDCTGGMTVTPAHSGNGNLISDST